MQLRDRGSSDVLKYMVWQDLYVHISVGKGTRLPSSLLQGCSCKTPHQIGSQGTKLLPMCASIRWTWLGTCCAGHYLDHSLNKPGSVQRQSSFRRRLTIECELWLTSENPIKWHLRGGNSSRVSPWKNSSKPGAGECFPQWEFPGSWPYINSLCKHR